jgi:hypothetical protein
MSITFTLTPADLRAFTRHARKSMPEFRRLRWFNLGFAALIAFSTSLTTTNSLSLPARILTFLILTAIIWLLMTAISAAVNWLVSSFRPNTAGLQGILCEHTISIDPDGLSESTAVNQSRSSWHGIHRIDASPHHLFIFIQPNMAHTIPRNAFPSPDAANQFLLAATTWHQTATAK